MSGVPQTTTLVFDVLGTLLDEDAGRLSAVRETFGRDAPAFSDRWQRSLDDAMAAVRDGRRPYRAAETLSAEAVTAAMVGTGDELSEAQARRLVTSGRRLPPFPDVVDALDRLARSHALLALTNAGTAQAFHMSRAAGLRWTTVVSGETVGAFKPDPRMYEHVLRSYELDPAECVFVAAHPWDLDAAARHGFRTAYVDRARSSPAELTAHAQRFDLAARDLSALADQLLAP